MCDHSMSCRRYRARSVWCGSCLFCADSQEKSTVYRMKKFVRRNRTLVLATAAVGLALVLGAGVAGGQAYRATKAAKLAEEQLHIANEQERLANEQAELAKKQKQLAEQAAQRERDLRTEAEAARRQSEAVTNFLVEIFYDRAGRRLPQRRRP